MPSTMQRPRSYDENMVLVNEAVRVFNRWLYKEYPRYQRDLGHCHIYRENRNSMDFIQFFPMLGFARYYATSYSKGTIIYTSEVI
jgi:hypothetical protein